MDLRGVTPLLQVYDMPTSIRFYRGTLGFQVHTHAPHRGGSDPDSFHWVWLKHGVVDLMLNTAYEFDEEASRVARRCGATTPSWLAVVRAGLRVSAVR